MDRPLRVAYITHYTELYGANRSLLDLMHALRGHHGVVPQVIVPRPGDLTVELDRSGIPWAVIPFVPWMSERRYSGRWYHRIMQRVRFLREARGRIASNNAVLPKLFLQFDEWGIDVIHLNSAAVGLASLLMRNSERPIVWHIREMPEAHYGLLVDGGQARYADALRNAQHVIAISEAVVADVREQATHLEHISCIPDGVLSEERFGELAGHVRTPRTEDRPFTFLQVGLIHPSKGQTEAVEALAILRDRGIDARLIIAGGGRDQVLRGLIVDRGLTGVVELRGFVSDPFPLYHEADALLMCSRHEALGRVTIEAMASGLPVIGHRSGATTEVLEQGRVGMLYEGGADALADRMSELMVNATMRASLIGNARASAAQRFTTERCGAAVMQVYRSVLGGHGN